MSPPSFTNHDDNHVFNQPTTIRNTETSFPNLLALPIMRGRAILLSLIFLFSGIIHSGALVSPTSAAQITHFERPPPLFFDTKIEFSQFVEGLGTIPSRSGKCYPPKSKT